MNLGELLAETRTELDDKEFDGRDVFWSDTRLVSLLNEGQDVFCEETGFIQDSSSAAATITGVADTQRYSLHPSIILVRRVELDGYPLVPLVYAQQEDPLWDADMIPEYRATSPVRWRSDKDSGKIEFVGTVQAGQEFNLSVWRRSLLQLRINNLYGKPEIPVRWHSALMEYACWKAQLKHDAETYNPRAAEGHRQEFYRKVSEGKRQWFRQHRADAGAVVGGLGWSW